MRRIKSAQVRFLTLCKRGANRMPVLYKSEDGTAEFSMLTKATDNFDEQGELLAVGYVKEYRDSQGDIADENVVKGMAYSFMQEGANLDIRHNGVKIEKSRAYVAENFLIQKNDPRFENFKDYNGNVVDVTGSWGLLIKIEDEELRKLYKQDGWNGVSLQGSAELEPDTDHVRKALDYYKEHLSQGDDLKPEELTKALADNNAALTTGLVTALKEVLTPKKEEKKEEVSKKDEPQPPAFEGDRTKAEDVKKHMKKVQLFNLAKTVDWNDPKSIDNYHKQLAEIEKKDAEGEGDDEQESVELREARKIIAKHEGRSDVPHAENKRTVSKSKVPDAFKGCTLSKEEEDGFERAQRMAKYINKTPETKGA